jgi:predicted membrane protein
MLLLTKPAAPVPHMRRVFTVVLLGPVSELRTASVTEIVEAVTKQFNFSRHVTVACQDEMP